jgi:hypothetical protein
MKQKKLHQEFEVRKSLNTMEMIVEIHKKETQVIINLEKVRSKIHLLMFNNFNFYLRVI